MAGIVDVHEVRRAYAEQLRRSCGLTTGSLIDALAAVPRERYLRPGPWLLRGERDPAGAWTADADPRHVYQNVSIAIDADRQLFNGAPGVVASWIDALRPAAGQRALHIGCGTGYYTAVLAHCIRPAGGVVGIEADARLAQEAAANLREYPNALIRSGTTVAPSDGEFDLVLVSAGMTHPSAELLDAVADSGRMVIPLTATFPQMGPLGKGLVLLLQRQTGGGFSVRSLSFTMIYSAVGLRDDGMNERLGAALMTRTAPSRLRRDAHPVSTSCWLHGEGFCLTT